MMNCSFSKTSYMNYPGQTNFAKNSVGHSDISRGNSINGKSQNGSVQRSITSAYIKDDNQRSLVRQLKSNSKESSGFRKQDNSILSGIQKYSESLRTQRQNAKNTSDRLKTLKYQYKDISSKLVRAKTSSSARQVVSQAKREVMRLKRQRQVEGIDKEELEAAITHAKAMERVAKKKVKHLEEEEMLKAAGGSLIEFEEEDSQSENEDSEVSEMNNPDDEYYESDPSEIEDSPFEDYEMEAYEMSEDELMSEFSQETMSNLSEELMAEFSEEMKSLLEDMGLDELTDSMTMSKDNLDANDLKMIKIKHRNKEAKDMVKADADYLKVIFDHLQKMKSASTSTISSGALANSGGTHSFGFDQGSVVTGINMSSEINLSI